MLRAPLVPALVLTLAATPLLTVGATPAGAKGRVKPTVSISASDTTPVTGDAVKFKGSVSGSSRGARVRLQEKQDGPWRVVDDGKVRRSGRYRLATEALDGRATYRVQVLRNHRLRRAASPTLEVTGSAASEPQLSSQPMRHLRAELGALIDEHRDDRGLGELWQTDDLGGYAQAWSVEQAERGQVLTRTSFEDAPASYEVVAEHTVLGGLPEALMGALEADARDVLGADGTWLGIGMELRDDDTGYWTITVATDAPEEPGDLGPDPATEEAVRQQILEETNAYRAAHGLAPLTLMDELDTVAQDWSRHMAANDVFHHNPSYSEQYPSGWRRAGENIAAGYGPDDVVDGWYASPGHKANMLGDFTHIGIGYATHPDSEYGRYYTQNFARY
ncbi:hypothetical protein NOK12_12360 [Nocardioides sp. OK12]|uniref:CAP domain-containing protein n=1 Tax=Nocardioides sp. OK12 TaxID=2758661 RepID=UPI0021C3744B|nr:CAP domain-containing protein [Nocardioides sp. OK12]GHJ58718.1 hypothetical protein NOK12_12360 [Nocardioides sp. OK12]